MIMKKIIINLFLIVILLSEATCKKDSCLDGDFYDARYNAPLWMTFKDVTTKKYLYDEAFPIYKKDSLIFTNEYNEVANLDNFRRVIINIDSTLNSYYVFSFNALYDSRYDKDPYNNTINKAYYIYYKSGMKDTLNVSFKMRDIGCNHSLFSFLKINYKQHIVFDTTNFADVASITINKP